MLSVKITVASANVLKALSIQLLYVGILKGFFEDIFWIKIESEWRKDAALPPNIPKNGFKKYLYHMTHEADGSVV